MSINTFFILASTSKSRRFILKKLNLNFKTIKPNCNEVFYKKKFKKLNYSPKKISLATAIFPDHQEIPQQETTTSVSPRITDDSTRIDVSSLVLHSLQWRAITTDLFHYLQWSTFLVISSVEFFWFLSIS